jgi:hypothetical protein
MMAVDPPLVQEVLHSFIDAERCSLPVAP